MALKFEIFNKYPELIYGFTEKQDGSMKIFDVKNQKEEESHRDNKRKYFSRIGVSLNDLVGASLVGGNNVYIVSGSDKGKIIDNTDALATLNKNVFLAITVSDCFPVYFYEPNVGIAAIAHAGWRGIAKNIIEKTLEKIDPKKEYRKNILVGIGPGIELCHFDVKNEVVEKFKNYPDFIIKKNNKVFVSLPGIIKHQLLEEGILENNIEISEDCTYCSDNKYFSWRRDKTKMMQGSAYIGIKNNKEQK